MGDANYWCLYIGLKDHKKYYFLIENKKIKIHIQAHLYVKIKIKIKYIMEYE